MGILTLAFNIQQVKAEVATLAAPVIRYKAPGSSFSISITVDEVEKLWGVQFTLRYNTIVLAAIDYGLYPPFTQMSIYEINDEEGYVCMGFYTYMGDSEGLTTVDPVPVCWIEFTVDDFGTSVLALPEYDVVTRKLIDVEANEFPHQAVDGFYGVHFVGGIYIPIDKLGLLAPYIGLASTIVVATVATAIYAKRVRRRKEKQ